MDGLHLLLLGSVIGMIIVLALRSSTPTIVVPPVSSERDTGSGGLGFVFLFLFLVAAWWFISAAR